MDYRIRQSSEELESTGFIEIGPGKFNGKHWNKGFIFIWEDAFGMAEGIISKHNSDYDHFAFNDLNKQQGNLIIQDWKKAADLIDNNDLESALIVLNANDTYGSEMIDELKDFKDSIQQMLVGLCTFCEEHYRTNDWMCVLGV